MNVRQICFRAASLLVCSLMALAAFSGCKQNESGSGNNNDGTTTTTAPAQATVPTGGQTPDPTAAPDNGEYPKTGYIKTNTSVNVRAEPNTNQEPIGGAGHGQTYTVLEKTGDWYKIEWKGGAAYINAQYIVFSDPGPKETTTTASASTTQPPQE